MLSSFMKKKDSLLVNELKKQITKHTFITFSGVFIHPKNNQRLVNTSSLCNCL